MDYLGKIIGDFEEHSVDRIRECFENGVNQNENYNGKPLIYELINMYTRSLAFKECIKFFVDFGLAIEDKALLSVLLDDAATLETLVDEEKELLERRYSFNCAYTPLFESSLLHVCAEYNHVDCDKLLINKGANVNVSSGLDEYGFGGQTPIFHTVNQNGNKSFEMM